MFKIYHGIDIVPVAKVRKIMRGQPHFAEEVFTPREREYCLSKSDPYIHFAARFAAKEAVLKALGTGLSGAGMDSALLEIEVISDKAARPALIVSGWTRKLAARRKINRFTVSISHSGAIAIASVILWRECLECRQEACQ